MSVMKKISLVLLLLAVAIGEIFVGGLVGTEVYAQVNAGRVFRPVEGVTFEQVNKYTDVKGNESMVIRQMYAMRSDGAVLEAMRNPRNESVPGWHERVLKFPSDGRKITINDVTRQKSTLIYPPGAMERFLSGEASRRAAQCFEPNLNIPGLKLLEKGNVEFLGPYKLKAYKAVIEDSRAVTTVWFSVDYNCLDVQHEYRFKDGNKQTLTTDWSTFKKGEPDPLLFRIPVDYAFNETRPSNMERTLALKVYGSLDQAPQCIRDPLGNKQVVDRMDASYGSFGVNRSRPSSLTQLARLLW